MEEHAGCLKIHTGRVAMQELRPGTERRAAQGTGEERAGERRRVRESTGKRKVGGKKETVEGRVR